MAWVPDTFAQDLAGIDLSKYVFIKCLVCQSCYRWGIYGFKEGAVHCPICGAVTWNPFLVSKMDYIHWMQRMKNVKNMGQLQRELWDWRQIDEAYQRR